jgi:hypothetical protein
MIRPDLFVRGLQLLVRRLHLLDREAQILPGRKQLRFELAAREGFLDLAGPVRFGRLPLEETHREHAFRAAPAFERADHEPNGLERSAAPHAAGGRDFLVFGDRPLHGPAQRRLEAVARQARRLAVGSPPGCWR